MSDRQNTHGKLQLLKSCFCAETTLDFLVFFTNVFTKDRHSGFAHYANRVETLCFRALAGLLCF